MNTLTHKVCRGALALAGLLTVALLTVMLSPFAAAAGVLGAAVIAPVGTTSTGFVDVSTQANRGVPQVLDAIDQYMPELYPVTTLIDKLTKTYDAHSVEIRWQEEGVLPRYVTVNGVTTAGTAGASKTITVDSRNAIKPRDTMWAPDNATDSALNYIVDSVTATTVTLKALPKVTATAADTYRTPVAFGTVPVFADNEVLYWISNAKSEEDAASQPAQIEPAFVSNFVQTFDLTAGMSDHAMRTLLYGTQGNWSEQLKKLVREFRKNRENAFVFNGMKSVTSGTNLNGEVKTTHTMTGLRGFLTDSISIPSSPTIANLVSFIYDAHDAFEGLGKRKILVGGTDVLERLDLAAAGLPGLQTTQEETVFGVTMRSLIGRKGRIDTVYHPGFDEQGIPDEGYLLDMRHLGRAVLQAPEPRDIEQKRAGAGVDRDFRQMISKEALVARMVTGEGAVSRRVTLA